MTQTPEQKSISKQRTKEALDRFFWVLPVVLVLAVLAAGYYLVIKDQYRELKTIKNVQVKEMNQQILELRQNKDFLVKNVGQVLKFSPAEEALMALALPSEFDFSSIVVQLTNLASRFNFVVNSLDVGEAKSQAGKIEPAKMAGVSGNNLGKINIKMELTAGSYDDLKKLIAAVESSIMIFDVVAVDFGDQGKYTLDLVSYYKK